MPFEWANAFGAMAPPPDAVECYRCAKPQAPPRTDGQPPTCAACVERIRLARELDALRA